ncbi:hypothetical protein N7520_008812 [Penicillium odoratum]|uniref:uncharacterized protein n=1 Tax=Penicillium odoratum TaxID=1167516 RepID=UPI0025489D8C|nr:uncharacterized protein N7520_008812 [Penicillium odoratum]KAJ5751895.1 hypothetical protein N7520_008812 [Penicillium odoratum]
MSATILENTRTTPVSVLVDYEVHHSGQEEHTPTNSLSPAPTTQPQNWPFDHRRIPAYRPISRNLDFSQRPSGANNVERVVITVMLHGVWLNAVTSRVWRFTGGRLNNRLFHYEIGGEW